MSVTSLASAKYLETLAKIVHNLTHSCLPLKTLITSCLFLVHTNFLNSWQDLAYNIVHIVGANDKNLAKDFTKMQDSYQEIQKFSHWVGTRIRIQGILSGKIADIKLHT